ncbi:MAG: PKD domain-containing protein [Methanomicrobiales archaeon]|nr:PKD domain-containing protein [Methanomicrobiales archaeon]
MKEVAKRSLFMLIAVVVITAMIGAVSAATTQVHVVKYANDGTTVLNETTVTFQWMEANLPILGDGVTHYYHQGPVFLDDPNETHEMELRWNPEETTNVIEKDMGAVKGTNLKDLCDLVGGMSPGEEVKLLAADGWNKKFAYKNVYEYSSREGPIGICWYKNGNYVNGSGYSEGMRMVWFADDSVNTLGPGGTGLHAFGNWDWHEAADEQYWYYYISGGEYYPTTTGLSGQVINRIYIYSDDPVPTAPTAAFTSDTQSGDAPLTVQFTDQSTGTAPLTYAWDFENDGTIDSTDQNPSHTYDTAGTYSVNLTVTNAAGSDSEVKLEYITVGESTPAPVAAFTAKSVRILNGNFETGTLDPWSASELVPYGDTPGVQIVTTGSYKKGTTGIRIWRTPVGGNAWIEQDVDLTDVDEIRFWRLQYAGTDRELQVLVDGTIVARYNETSGTINRYETVDLSSYGFTGTHTLRFNSYCYGGTALFSLYLDDIEGYGTTTSGTAPLTVQFTDASTGDGITAWAWDFENDGTVDSTDQNPSHVYDTPGTYTVKLTVTNAGGSDDEVKTDFISVSAAPTPWTVDLVGASSYTMPNTEFEALAAAHPVSWTDGSSNVWSGVALWRLLALVDDGDPATFNDAFAAAGYSVQIMASDGFSRQFSSADIARNDGRIVANRINGEYLSEDRFPLRFVGSGLTGGQMVSKISSIDLYLPITASAGTGGTIDPSGTITIPYDGSQSFAITPDTGYHISDVLVDGVSVGAVMSYTFENVTAAHTIDASFAADGPAAPVADFTADVTSGTAPMTVQFTDQSSGVGITSWAWDFENDGTVDSTEQNPSHTYDTAGTYSVNLTVTNAAGSDSEVKADYIVMTGGPSADVLFNGDVNLAPGTFSFTAYNTGTEYQVDRLTPHGVLEEASRQAGFSYDASDKKWATMGTMLLDNVGTYLYNSTVSPKLCWAYQVNGVKKNDFSSTEGISVYRVNDGDLVEFYYGQDGGAFEDALAVIRGRVHIRDQTVLFDDDVTLLPGTFDFTAYNSGTSYQINTTTPHGALDAASKIAGFTYNATDKKWSTLGTMLLDDVGDYRYNSSPDPDLVWAYAVNGVVKNDFSSAEGISSYQLQNNDRVEFFYGDKGDTLENATAVVRIRVHISSMDTWTLTLIGAQTTPISKQYFEEAVDCIHSATYTDVAGTWQGVPLWTLAGYVDDANFHGPNAFNDTLAATNYTVKVIASDGFNKTFYSTQIARDDDYIVANTLNGQPLPVQYWPLKLVGADVPPSSSVARITTIEVSVEPIQPPTESPSVRIIKYAADGVTEVANISVNVTTMERNFPVIGNGTTVYRFEGINFVPNDIWDANETYPGGFKIENAVKGTRIRDLCELAGGMGSATDIRLVAKDGWETVLPYSSIYTNPAVQARQGDAILAWYADGKYVPEYVDGMRLFFTPDDHIYGQWDMHETLPSNYWHYYYQDGIQYPSCAGLSAKWISTIKIYSAPESDWSLELDGTAIGGINYTVSKTYFEQALACQFGANHGVEYTDAQDNVWYGMPLWFLAGFVDDADQHSDNAFNDSLAAAGYDVKITALDGATLVVDSRDIVRNNNYIVANTLNGFQIPEESSSWPLRLVGPSATGSSSIKGISAIELVPASQPSQRLYFSPAEQSVFHGGSRTFTLVLSEAPEGLSGCNVTISLSDGSIATLTGITYPSWVTINQSTTLPADSVTLKVADLTKQVETGATDIAIATFTVQGDALGSTDLVVSVHAMDDDDGAVITPAVSPATFRVLVPVQPIDGVMPTDPDGDGLYDDMNGNGRADFNDVVIFFNNIEWIRDNEPVQYFDFNGNGRIDFDDVVELFWGV